MLNDQAIDRIVGHALYLRISNMYTATRTHLSNPIFSGGVTETIRCLAHGSDFGDMMHAVVRPLLRRV